MQKYEIREEVRPMENEVVSKNFIEQIIEKDLAEGHCKTVKGIMHKI